MDYTLTLCHGYNNDNRNYNIDNNNGCHLMNNTIMPSKRSDGVNANSAQLMTNNNNIRASTNKSRASHEDIGYMHLSDDAKFTFIADHEENRINRREARWATKHGHLDMDCVDISHPMGTSSCGDGGNAANGQRGSGECGCGSGGNKETRCMSPSQLKGFTEELVKSIMCKVKNRMELPEGQEDKYPKECEKKVTAFVTQLNSSGVKICPPDSKNNSNDPNYKLSEKDEIRGSGSNEGKNSGAEGGGSGGSVCTSCPSNEPAGCAGGGAVAPHPSGAASTSNSVAHPISGSSGGTGGCPNIASARIQHGRVELPCFGVYLSHNCGQTPVSKSTAVSCPNLKNGASAMGGQDGGALMCFKTACVAMPESADDQWMFLTDLLQTLFTGVRSKLQSMLMSASGDAGGPEVADVNAAPNIDHIMDGGNKEVEMTLLPHTVECIIALHEEGVPLDSIDCDFSMVAYYGLFVDTIVTNTVLVKCHDQQHRRNNVKSFVSTDIKD